MLDVLRPSSLVGDLAAERLIWLPERGLGFYPVTASALDVYDRGYFENYKRLAETPIGHALMQFRVDFVAKHYDGPLVDVGIGSGAFIDAREDCLCGARATFGYDINPNGVAWLRNRGLYLNPNLAKVPAVTMWDVLEHIEDFRPLLANVVEWCFVSIPIFGGGVEHVLRSKHYKKEEHCWYFTQDGFLAVMSEQGFDCVDISQEETNIGREDILTFALRRR